jgi:hypothetical protein
VVPLIGRDRERGTITGLLEVVQDGGGALVVHGEAGVEKSALLAWAADSAADQGMLALSAAGAQPEMPFAARGHPDAPDGGPERVLRVDGQRLLSAAATAGFRT